MTVGAGGPSGGGTGLAALVELATGLVRDRRRAVLGVAGAPGAGKTTLVEALLVELAAAHGDEWVAHLPMDGYHLSDAQLERLDALSRKGAADTFDGYGYAHVLRRVREHPQEDVYVPGFERTLEQPIAAALHIPPSARLVVTEGNYLLLPDPGWVAVRGLLTRVWYVDLPDPVRLARLTHRHEEFGKDPEAAAAWAHGPDQANAALVARTRDHADLVVSAL